MHLSAILVALPGASNTALATPMDHRLEDVQCRCLSFATDAKPSLCTYMGAHQLDWHTAASLANDYDLKINFASRDTITKVLSIHRPLPTSVLESISEGEAMPLDSKNLMQRENRIVCGFGDEVKRIGGPERALESDDHFMGIVSGVFMLLIAFYVVVEYACSRYVSPRGYLRVGFS